MNWQSLLRLTCGLVITLAFLTQAASACPTASSTAVYKTTGKSYALAMETNPTPIQVGKVFSARLHICDHQARPFTGRLKAGATMPLHKHGMNYRPSVSVLGDGKFRLDGYVFHMPGMWQFSFDLKASDGTERLLIEHTLGP